MIGYSPKWAILEYFSSERKSDSKKEKWSLYKKFDPKCIFVTITLIIKSSRWNYWFECFVVVTNLLGFVFYIF